MKAETRKMQTERNGRIPLGARENGGYYEFAVFLPGINMCELRIYDILSAKEEATVNLSLFAQEELPGVFAVRIKKEELPECFGYRYAAGGREFLDAYTRYTVGREQFGVRKETFGVVSESMSYAYYAGTYIKRGTDEPAMSLKKNNAMLLEAGEEKRADAKAAAYRPFSWKEEKAPRLAYEDMILYKLHVRGFTMTAPGVRHRGTYLGLLEKKKYLLELGVNALLLLPCVEFDEFLEEETRSLLPSYAARFPKKNEESACEKAEIKKSEDKTVRVNYWGFAKENCYFAPKASYAARPYQAASEFKQMVAGMHESGIEVLLEMNFKASDNPNLIRDCLIWWVQEYHVDGFRYNTDLFPAHMAALCPELSGVKILAAGFGDTDAIARVDGFGARTGSAKDQMHAYTNGSAAAAQKTVLAQYDEGFLREIRRFVKGDEEMVGAVAARLERQTGSVGVINYLADHNGFTLADVYAYDVKHNEANGEENRDGTDYNFSWNCGSEGTVKKKKLLKLRSQMRKNALMLLFLAQGTPMLLAGDEFGNTQKGNNNAYCQDNETGWVSWKELRTNKEQFEFVKQLIALRKAHPVLHNKVPLRGMDYISCGCPDVSRHGTKAWYPDYSNYSRTLAMLFCGKYAMIDRKTPDHSIYIAANMHWEPHVFDLPDIHDGEELTFLFCSDPDCTDIKQGQEQPCRTFEVPSRSIALFLGKASETESASEKRRAKAGVRKARKDFGKKQE